MIDVWFTTDPPCTCGRRRHTQSDIDHWNATKAWRDVPHAHHDWSRGICWTKHGVRCNMKPVDPITALR